MLYASIISLLRSERTVFKIIIYLERLIATVMKRCLNIDYNSNKWNYIKHYDTFSRKYKKMLMMHFLK